LLPRYQQVTVTTVLGGRILYRMLFALNRGALGRVCAVQTLLTVCGRPVHDHVAATAGAAETTTDVVAAAITMIPAMADPVGFCMSILMSRLLGVTNGDPRAR
jgi:hypothetical protein